MLPPEVRSPAPLDGTELVETLARRLVREFPAVGWDDMVELVAGELHTFDGAPIRVFVDVLVERKVRAGIVRRARPRER